MLVVKLGDVLVFCSAPALSSPGFGPRLRDRPVLTLCSPPPALPVLARCLPDADLPWSPLRSPTDPGALLGASGCTVCSGRPAPGRLLAVPVNGGRPGARSLGFSPPCLRGQGGAVAFGPGEGCPSRAAHRKARILSPLIHSETLFLSDEPQGAGVWPHHRRHVKQCLARAAGCRPH